MQTTKDKIKRSILVFIALSILLHFLLGAFFYLFPEGEKKTAQKNEETQVVWVKPQLPLNPEIADIEKPAVEKRPQKSRFVGEHDSSVKEEKVAKPKPPPKKIQENPNSEEEAPKKIAEKQHKPKPEKEKSTKTTQTSDLTLKSSDVTPQEKPKKEKKEKSPDFKSSSNGLAYGRPSAPDLFPHDYYPDYKVGGKTYLNVMRLEGVGYFAKMKRILKMRWNPSPPVRAYLSSHRIEVGKIECVIGLALDSSGQIAELMVIKTSGVAGYEQEALQTIRDSSPFSSPPADYLKYGLLRMSWTFTVFL